MICKGLEDLGFYFPVPEGAFYVFVPMEADLVQRIIKKVLSSSRVSIRQKRFRVCTFQLRNLPENINVALGRIQTVMRD